MQSKRLLSAFVAASALVATLSCGACGPAKTPAEVALGGLPAYDAEAQAEFDDSIDPVIAGLTLDKPIYRGDLRLRARSQHADTIVRARLTTVSEERADDRKTFQLTFRTSARLGGPVAPQETIEVTLREGSPSFGMVSNTKEKLRGKQVILLVRTFREKDASRLHAVVLPDDPDVLAAVQENIALEELKK